MLPPSCNQKVYEEGKVFAIVHAPADVLQAMVEKIHEYLTTSSSEIDWHYVGGWGAFKTLGDVDRAKNAMDLVMPIRKNLEGYGWGDE